MTDDFQLFDQSSDDPVDADIALISAYLARELSPVQIVAVEDRLASDIAFRKKVAPILDAWVMPTALSAVHAGQGPLSRDEVEAGWTRYVGEHVELDAHEGPRLVVEGAQRKRRKISMTRIAAGIAAITLPVFALAQVVVYASKHPNVPGHSAAKEFMAPFVVEPPTSDATPTPLPHKPPPAPVDVPIGRQLDTKTADVQRVAEVVLPAAESLKALAPTPVAQTVPWQPSNPDRAKIMELVKQHMPEVVRGDTTADYALVLLDASDNYVWSTHGLGGVTLVIGGDKRTAAERAELSFRNASQYSGVMVDSIGRLGRVSRGGGGAGFAYDSMVVAGRAGRGSVAAGERDTLRFQRVPDSVIARIRDTVSGVIGRIDTARAGARGGLGGGGGRGGFARGGGGGGGRASGAVAYGGFDVGPLDSGSYVLSIGAPIAVGGVRVPLNTAAGLQEPGRDESGIQGLKASSLTMVENYFFTRGQLAPRPLRVLVGHLAPGTRWTGR